MKILITGAGGFAGTHLSRWFRNAGHEVIGLTRATCDLRDLPALTATLRQMDPQYIIHLASKTAPARGLADTAEQIEANILTTANLCLAAPSSVKLLALFGSIEEYGENEPPFSEGLPPSVISIYGWSKISARALADYICKQRSIPWTWIRPSLFFGVGLPETRFFGHVLGRCLRNETAMLTPCEQTRDFYYIEDLGGALECVLNHSAKAQGRTWNICSGLPRQLKEVAMLIQQTAGRGALDFGAIPYRPNEVMNFYADPSAFLLQFDPPELTPFVPALIKTVQQSLSP